MNFIFILSIKPNLNIDDAVNFLNKITENGEKTFTNLYAVLPYHLLKEASEKFSASGIVFGSPYLSDIAANSFTGPVAVEFIKNAGAKFVLIGSKEERILNANNLADKLKLALENQLKPIVCIGETFQQRQENQSFEVIKDQLLAFNNFSFDKDLIVIYQIPFLSFQDYLPINKEIEEAHELCIKAAEALSYKDKITWTVELPVDLAGFSENISDYPFKGYYFVKAGIFPHALHSEALQLFHLHSE